MKTILTFTATLLLAILTILPSHAQNKGMAVRLGVMMEAKQKSIQGIPAKTVVPAITIETARNVVRNFAISAEIGFGMYELEYKSTVEGAKSQLVMMSAAAKAIIQADVIENGRIYGGAGVSLHRYSEAGVMHPDYKEVDPTNNILPFLFAGAQYTFDNGIGFFAEAGYGKTKSNKAKQYFKVGLAFTY